MVQTLAEPHHVRLRLSIDSKLSHALTPEQGIHLFSIVKEAMSNSLRHARAKQASVSLRSVKDGIRLTVSDNGVGFIPSHASGIGHGLANMAARASRIGGKFSVQSKPKQGTRIILNLPRETSHA
jgi:signal transduction histidine kinase